jgi:hypothetical protein
MKRAAQMSQSKETGDHFPAPLAAMPQLVYASKDDHSNES